MSRCDKYARDLVLECGFKYLSPRVSETGADGSEQRLVQILDVIVLNSGNPHQLQYICIYIYIHVYVYIYIYIYICI